MTDHARIQAFLQQQSIIPLLPMEGGEGERVIKAGVVPFIFSPSPLEREGGVRGRAFQYSQTLEYGGTAPHPNPSHKNQMLGGRELLFLTHQPVAKRPELGAPPFQLCKGTRMRLDSDNIWRDIREEKDVGGDMETLAATALREGMEELGLMMEGITALYDAGPYRFASAKSGREKLMWLFALEMTSPEHFLPDAAIADTTTARRWMSADEFAIAGRDDHRYILKDIEAKLVKFPLPLGEG